MVIDSKNLHEMSNAVRATALRALRHAKSGHVGIALGAADIITMIYAVFLNPSRDRFVLSAGHGSALLYATLKLAGYRVGELDSLRRLNGLPGHPEFGIDGVSATTGPLGQGVANAVGMAIAEKHLERDGKIYCICSDGDLMEGVAQEAISFAGRYELNNLVLLWDNNGVSIDGAAQTDVNVAMRMLMILMKSMMQFQNRRMDQFLFNVILCWDWGPVSPERIAHTGLKFLMRKSHC